MPPFNELFGGKNSNAINTIFYVLNKVLKKDISAFGLVELDPRQTFSKKDIVKKWKEQGKKCHYTEKVLDIYNIAGDHYIPRSEGIEAGGLTEYSNLVVCSKFLNNKKSNMSPKAFEKLIATVEEDLKS